jgi:hypothetical protein
MTVHPQQALDHVISEWRELNQTLGGPEDELRWRYLDGHQVQWLAKMSPDEWASTLVDCMKVVVDKSNKKPLALATWWPRVRRDFAEEMA